MIVMAHPPTVKTAGRLSKRERNVFYLTTHSTHFIYGYMASDIWLRTILIVRKETRCRHIGYSYRLTARVLLYAPSHRQDNTYHGLCYTSRGALADVSVNACLFVLLLFLLLFIVGFCIVVVLLGLFFGGFLWGFWGVVIVFGGLFGGGGFIQKTY